MEKRERAVRPSSSSSSSLRYIRELAGYNNYGLTEDRPSQQTSQDEQQEGRPRLRRRRSRAGTDANVIDEALPPSPSRRAPRGVAHSRAAHFARFDGESSSAVPAPVPVPVLPPSETKSDDGGESDEASSIDWSVPAGPWSTAHALIRARPAAARARKRKLEEDQQHGASASVSSSPSLSPSPSPAATWRPSRPCTRSRRRRRQSPPSLFDLSAKLIVKHIDQVEAIGIVPSSVRARLAAALAARGRLCGTTLRTLLRTDARAFGGSGLTELSIPDCSGLTEENVDDIISAGSLLPPRRASSTPPACRLTLTVLELGMCGRGFSDHSVDSLLKTLPELSEKQQERAIAVAGEGASSASLPLEVLRLTGCYRLSHLKLTELLQRAPAITSLDMSETTFIGKETVQMLSSRLVCPNLVTLSLDNCARLADEPDSLTPLASARPPAFRGLSLAGLGSAVSDELLLAMVGAGALSGETQRLVLDGATALTDASVRPLIRQCRRLRRLSLEDLPAITDATFAEDDASVGAASAVPSALSLPQLQYAALGRCSQLTDSAVCALAASVVVAAGGGGGLKHLQLNGLRISDDSLVALAGNSGAASLTALDISFCRGVSDGGLGHLTDTCTELRDVTLWGCTQITDRFLNGHREGVTLTGTPL